MEKMLKSNKLLLIILFSLMVLVGAFSYNILNSQNVALADGIKAYRYEILKENNQDGYSLLGYYTDNSYYVLESDSTNIDSIFAKIELDRGEQACDAEIFLHDVDIGNYNIVLSRGNYILSGNVSFINISSNACFSITDTANVVMQNFILTNYATAPAILLCGNNTSLQMNQCEITAYDNSVVVQNSSSVTMSNSTIISQVGHALKVDNASMQVMANCSIYAKGEKSAIAVSGQYGSLSLYASQVISASSRCFLENADASVTLYGRCSFQSRLNAIETNVAISASYNSESLMTGQTISLYFTGELDNTDTLIVSGYDPHSSVEFNLLNLGYNIRLLGNNLLYISKKFSIYYHANCSSSITMPIEDETYYDRDYFDIQYLSEGVRGHYIFCGYAYSANATVPDLTTEQKGQINGSDVHLYAIWRPITYSITYINVAPGECSNVTEYNYNQHITINNPTRQYYTFTGWLVNGVDLVKNLTLPYGNYDELNLTAQFELTSYSIQYQNLTEEQVADLNLITTYTIASPDLQLNSQNYLIRGYSYLGLYDENNTNITNAVVHFDPSQTNTVSFEIGKPLVIVVDARCFYNGGGDGTQNNPFIMDSSEQFYNFVHGAKCDADISYIKLNNDIVLNEDFTAPISTIKNVYIFSEGKTITVNKLCAYTTNNGFSCSVLPNLENCTIKGITFAGFLMCDINTGNKDLIFSEVAKNVSNCYFEEVTNKISSNIIYKTSSVLAKAQLSGFVNNSKNTIFNKCSFSGGITIDAQSPARSVYVCAFSTDMSNTLLSNCKNTGKIAYTTLSDNDNENASLYMAGYGIARAGNLIANSEFSGKLQVSHKAGNQTVLSGFIIVLRADNKLVNDVSIGFYKFNEQEATSAENVVATALIWSVFAGTIVDECIANQSQDVIYESYNMASGEQVIRLNDSQIEDKDYNDICNQALDKAQQSIDAYLSQNAQNITVADGIKATIWSENSEEQIEPQEKIVVRIYNNVNGEVKVYIFNASADRKIIVSDMFGGYLFEEFYTDDKYTNKFTELNNINGNLILYAKYISFKDYTLKQCIVPFIIIGIDLLLLIAFMVYCERPRKVIFVQDGVEVNGAYVKWGKKITLPKADEDVLYFKDAQGKNVCTSYKMPFVFGAYKLYSFTGEQGKALKAMYDAENKYKEELKAKRKDKAFKQTQKQLQKAKKNTKKSKVQQEIEKAGITIIKKDVQISKKK